MNVPICVALAYLVCPRVVVWILHIVRPDMSHMTEHMTFKCVAFSSCYRSWTCKVSALQRATYG